ncbi:MULTISPECIES: acyl carrier protein [Streptomyces]|uniref:Acyl carrier protein n=2 Tax=Streptomyces TaxID=1883 RepID=A0ABX1H331_9ACTN|nr:MULTISPECIES: acyl carrier protein [Streptomyces]AJE83745.1 putative acyl carrier protein [Streptomyces albus]AOU78051.1 putative acyl carrier protein [Streptomyces albus]AYN33806.1 acyl carrier protein [Streptomyces albus]NKI42438.1 acyl carrier protein [Streptomyces physcomitrii]
MDLAQQGAGTVAEQLGEVVARNFGVDPRETPEDTPLHGLRLDSLALEELRLLVEDRFGIDLDDVELTTRDSYGQLVAAVHGKTSA